jgi:YaiO family outer membrane protein
VTLRTWLVVGLVAGCLAGAPGTARAQSGWAVDFGGERSAVTDHGVDSIWSTVRFQLGYVNEQKGGLFGGVERQERYDLVDVSVYALGYRRLGDWTIAGGVGGTPDADFLYRVSANVELSRRLVGSLVVSAGYRYMDFPGAVVHQIQPAVTWYHRRSEVGGRLFVTRNTTLDRTSVAGLVTALVEVHPRVRLFGAVAVGDRIFDVTSFATGAANSWVARGTVRIRVTAGNYLEFGAGVAHEDPSFDQTTLIASYRRSF